MNKRRKMEDGASVTLFPPPPRPRSFLEDAIRNSQTRGESSKETTHVVSTYGRKSEREIGRTSTITYYYYYPSVKHYPLFQLIMPYFTSYIHLKRWYNSKWQKELLLMIRWPSAVCLELSFTLTDYSRREQTQNNVSIDPGNRKRLHNKYFNYILISVGKKRQRM